MKLQKLHVKNIRSYKDLDMDFCDGVTVISGPNGSGKSSILEACFLALFGTHALSGTMLQAADMITRGESSAEIVLDFEHAGDLYRIEQRFRMAKGAGTASNSKSVLYKNGEPIADSAKKTYDAVCALLNMDETAYENCAYIRQGEVDALINAKPKDRQKMIDDLLSLGKTEEYRERAAESKKAVARLVRAETGKFTDLMKKADEFKEKDLQGQIDKTRERIGKIDGLINMFENEKLDKNEQIVRTKEQLALAKSRREEKEKIQKAITELETAKRKNEDEKEKTLSSISENAGKSDSASKMADNLRTEIENAVSEKYENDPEVFGATLEEILGKDEKRTTYETVEEGTESRSSNEEMTESRSSNDELTECERSREACLSEAVRSAENKIREKKQSATEKRKSAGNQILEVRENVKKTNDELKETEKQIAKFHENISRIDSDTEKLKLDKIAAKEALSKYEKNYAECFAKYFPEADIEFSKADVESSESVTGLQEQDSESEISEKFFDLVEKAGEFSGKELETASTNASDKKAVAASKKSGLDALKAEIPKAIIELEKMKSERKETDEEILKAGKETEKLSKNLHDMDFLKKMTLENIAKLSEQIPEDMKLYLEVSENESSDKTENSNKTENAVRKELDVAKTSQLIEDKRLLLESEVSKSKAELASVLKTIEKSKNLIKEGRCPTCGQIVDEDHLPCDLKSEEERLKELQDRLSEIDKEIKKTDGLKNIMKEIKKFSDSAADIVSKIKLSETALSEKRIFLEKLNENLKKTDTGIQEQELKIKSREEEVKNAEGLVAAAEKEAADAERSRKEIADCVSALKLIRGSAEKELSRIREFSIRKTNQEKVRKMTEEQIRSAEDMKLRLSGKLKEEQEKEISLGEDFKVLSELENRLSTELSFFIDLRQKTENLSEMRQSIAILKMKKSGLLNELKAVSNAIAEKENQINEKRNDMRRIESLSGTDDEISLAGKQAELEESIKDIDEKLGKWKNNKSEFLEKTGSLESELYQYKKLLEEAAVSENRINYLNLVQDDVGALESMYMRIRTELRSRNIRALDQLLNDMFSFIYANNAYSRIELDSEYNLKVYEKNGTVLEPRLLSGGERALFNLSLRCAIYRFLSYGFGSPDVKNIGNRKNGENCDNSENCGKSENSKTSENNDAAAVKHRVDLPPMILDEPTVFLDSGHIGQLIKLISLMKNLGVGQIIVVSHDESLIDSADKVFRIEKDGLTNTSSFEEEERGNVSGLF